jgi:putative ABC transport system ATP-binding protein
MGSMIEITDITKTYNLGKVSTQVLMGVSLTVETGEFVAIMGPSGTGKSTLMHILGLLDRPSSGRYLLEGRDVTKISDNALSAVRNQKMGFVFQAFHLLARSTALSNVLLPLTYTPNYPPDAKERAKAALEAVGLGHRLTHRPGELSGGERQRVAIARALVQDPGILFADEPTGNLDNRSSYEIMDIFQRLNQAGKTIVIVTHEDEIARHCKRVIRLNYGRIAEDIRVQEPLVAADILATMAKDKPDASAAAGINGQPAPENGR